MELGPGHHLFISPNLFVLIRLQKIELLQSLHYTNSLSGCTYLNPALIKIGGSLGPWFPISTRSSPQPLTKHAPERNMPLNDMQCRTALQKEKVYKLSDGDGLYLEIKPIGGKFWRQKYRYGGKEKKLTHGAFPKVSLPDARKKTLEAIKVLMQGLDPAVVKSEKKQLSEFSQEATFEQLSNEWLVRQTDTWTARYMQSVQFRMKKYVYPDLGYYPPRKITPPLMLAFLQKIEKTSPETTRRVKVLCSHIFKYGIVTDRVDKDPSYGIESALKKFRRGHYAQQISNSFKLTSLKYFRGMYNIQPEK